MDLLIFNTLSWEQRKLSNIAERITRKNEKLESTLPLTISAQYGLIDQNEFFDKRIASKDVSGYYLVRKGEFAYNKSTSSDAPWGAIKRLDRYECGVLSTLYIVFRILDEGKTNSDYLVTYYDTVLWHKVVQVIAAEGARNHGLLNIAPADFFETTVLVPKDIEEQRKIGAYIKKLDHLITLHQSKAESWKTRKNRFLTISWEQRKLSNIAERITRKNEKLESTLPLTISAQYGLIDQNEFFDKRIASKDVSGYYLVRKGEFAYNKSTSSDAPWGAIKRLDRYECGVLSTLYIVFRILDEGKTNSDYLVTYYDTVLWHKVVQVIAAEGARNHGLLNIAPADFFETTVLVPKDIEEQRKIGAYIKKLDHLITLHQSKAESWKTRKNRFLTISWEQRKVREVTDRYDNLRIPVAANLRIAGSTPYYGANGIQDYVAGYTHEGEFILVAEDGANDLKNYPVKFVKGRIWVNNHAHVLQGKDEIADNKFLAFAISQADIESLLVGGSRAKLNAETLMEIDLLLPEKQEQVSIGNYFANLDHLITLHQRKLNRTQICNDRSILYGSF